MTRAVQVSVCKTHNRNRESSAAVGARKGWRKVHLDNTSGDASRPLNTLADYSTCPRPTRPAQKALIPADIPSAQTKASTIPVLLLCEKYAAAQGGSHYLTKARQQTNLEGATLALRRSLPRGGRQVLLGLARGLHAGAVALPHDALLPAIRAFLAFGVLHQMIRRRFGKVRVSKQVHALEASLADWSLRQQ